MPPLEMKSDFQQDSEEPSRCRGTVPVHFNLLLPEAASHVSESLCSPRPVGGTVGSVDALVGRGVELQRPWPVAARQLSGLLEGLVF